MKICFPVVENQGLDSRIHGRFGTAGTFLVVDSETRQVEEVANHDPLSGPVQNLKEWQVDAVVAGNIGGRTLARLAHSGLKMLQACKPTVVENLDVMAQSGLAELTSSQPGEGFAPGVELGRQLGCGAGRGLGRRARLGAGRGAGRGGCH